MLKKKSSFKKGLCKSRHQDGIGYARNLLGEVPVRENEEGSQRRLRELSNHDADLPPVKKRGKDGRLGRKHLRLQYSSKKFSKVAGKSLRTLTQGVLVLPGMTWT